MAYEPVASIPLQDLGNSTSSLALDDESDASATSDFFDDIDRYESAEDRKQDFLSDPNFQAQLQIFQGSESYRNLCWLVLALVLVIWTAGLIAYSAGNFRKATSGMWRGEATNLVPLTGRNVSLNTFLPQRYNVTFENYRKATFMSPRKRVDWLRPAQFPHSDTQYANGYYLTESRNGYVVRQHGTDFKFHVLESLQFSYGNTFFYTEDIQLNPGAPIDDTSTFHLLISDLDRQWRQSQFSIYWIWLPSTETAFPLQPPGADPTLGIEKLHFARFDPSGKYIIFGYNHDLFLYELAFGKTIRITSNGSPDIFNGKPDFVYEEEVMAADHMVWWCPDLSNFVYATLNDTLVEDYELDYFVKDPTEVRASYRASGKGKVEGVNQYPVRTSIKYPKPGTNIPIFSLAMFNVSLKELFLLPEIKDENLGEDAILYDAQWIDANHLLLKLSDRTSTKLAKKVFLPSENMTVDVSLTDASDFGGWVEKASTMAIAHRNDQIGYFDKVVLDDVVQLALFDEPTSTNYSQVLGPIYYRSPLAYDAIENVVYGLFGTDFNHTFASVSLNDGSMKIIQENGKYMPHFSPDGQFVDLEYAGPLLPWQKLINMADIHADINLDEVKPLNDQAKLLQAVETTNLPTRVYSKVKVGQGKNSAELNMVEIFPPGFNPKSKHPLLVHVYGGPGSAIVDYAFKVEFEDIVSAQLNAVVLIIDPRGTNPDNWKLKSCAAGQLGFWEPRDLVTVTKDYVKANKYIDETKTAVWGWSYGGFTTLKTLEFDQGEVFKFGAAVAPVTNWMFYDAIYTERYMKSVSNPNYRAISRINGFENFKNAKRFLIMHGSADDNVHLQNTMWLLDNFDVANVENYDIHIFPDSDHSIYYHNANDMVYDRLFWWLEKAFKGFYD